MQVDIDNAKIKLLRLCVRYWHGCKWMIVLLFICSFPLCNPQDFINVWTVQTWVHPGPGDPSVSNRKQNPQLFRLLSSFTASPSISSFYESVFLSPATTASIFTISQDLWIKMTWQVRPLCTKATAQYVCFKYNSNIKNNHQSTEALTDVNWIFSTSCLN